MKILVTLAFIFGLTTSLWCDDKSYNQYMNMKKGAYSLYEEGNKEDAILFVDNFIENNPKDLRAQNLLAVLYYWSSDLKKSKSILLKILEKEQFPQSATLLKRIEKKEEKLLNRSKKEQKQIEKNSTQTKPTTDILYLEQKIQKDPNDLLSRKILAKHYEKKGDKTKAHYFANAVLKIDPDDSQMLNYIKTKGQKKDKIVSKQTVESALQKLSEFYADKEYGKFMNLYNSLEHNNVVIPTMVHVDALYSAIELKQYKKAKSILHIYRMPQNKYITKIEKLVDEKLLLSRFAKLEE